MIYRAISLAITILAFSSGASSQTALDMYSWCEGLAEAKAHKDQSIFIPTDFDTGVCWGSFRTIQVLVTFADPNNGKTMLGICTPENARLTQLVKIFRRFVDEHPEKGHLEAEFVAFLALRQAFPCN